MNRLDYQNNKNSFLERKTKFKSYDVLKNSSKVLLKNNMSISQIKDSVYQSQDTYFLMKNSPDQKMRMKIKNKIRISRNLKDSHLKFPKVPKILDCVISKIILNKNPDKKYFLASCDGDDTISNESKKSVLNNTKCRIHIQSSTC